MPCAPTRQEALAHGFPFVAYFGDAALGEDPVWGALGNRLGVFAYRSEATERVLTRLDSSPPFPPFLAGVA